MYLKETCRRPVAAAALSCRQVTGPLTGCQGVPDLQNLSPGLSLLRTCCWQLPEPKLPPGGLTSSQGQPPWDDGGDGELLGEGDGEGEDPPC